MVKSVLVVGAGPAGLVATKSLLEFNTDSETFKVVNFEAAHRIGGMWRVDAGEAGDKCTPDMRTNLSRFTVTFPDFAWQSVDLGKANPSVKGPSENLSTQHASPPFLRTDAPSPFGMENDQTTSGSPLLSSHVPTQESATQPETANSARMFSGSKPATSPPLFPRAFEVGRYLHAYAQKFIPSGTIHLNRRVMAADLITQLDQGPHWKVTSIDCKTGQEFTDVFDNLVVASGFFGTPVSSLETSLPIQHSSKFEDVSTFGDRSGNIVVVGGGISGAEAAATAALQISSAKHSPGEKRAYAESIVRHVFDQPFHTLPRFLGHDSFQFTNEGEVHFKNAPRYLPLDLILYELSHKGAGRISASNGLASPEKAMKGHMFISLLAGGSKDRQQEYVSRDDEQQHPPRVSITDTYSEFVRSGLIVPVRGRVTAVGTDETSRPSFVEVQSKGDWAFLGTERTETINDVVGLIEATGFTVALDYLADDVKRALNYDPLCRRVPITLARNSIFNPNVPNLAFVGFYEGPFWAVMDMQARVVARSWAGKHPLEPQLDPEMRAVLSDISESASVREAIKSHARNIPQFWMADHAGVVEELSRLVGVPRDDSAFGGQKGPFLSARYLGRSVTDDSTKIVLEVANLFNDPASHDTSRRIYQVCLASAIFRGLQGKWHVQRTVHKKNGTISKGPEATENQFKGIANLHPRRATTPSATEAVEYLYVEEGTWHPDRDHPHQSTGSCVFSLDDGSIAVWDAGADGNAGRLCHTLDFYAEDNGQSGWKAKVSRTSGKLNCTTVYEFRCKAIKVDTWLVTHTVTTMDKEYMHETVYNRHEDVI